MDGKIEIGRVRGNDVLREARGRDTYIEGGERRGEMRYRVETKLSISSILWTPAYTPEADLLVTNRGLKSRVWGFLGVSARGGG
jgi:hypothetical protein